MKYLGSAIALLSHSPQINILQKGWASNTNDLLLACYLNLNELLQILMRVRKEEVGCRGSQSRSTKESGFNTDEWATAELLVSSRCEHSLHRGWLKDNA
jgi:hypothetical protein